MLGFVSPALIPRYLACMDVYVCPSVRETYGISIVQAMAMALPVVHYGVDGIRDYAQHGVNSLNLRSWMPSELAETLAMLVTSPST